MVPQARHFKHAVRFILFFFFPQSLCLGASLASAAATTATAERSHDFRQRTLHRVASLRSRRSRHAAAAAAGVG